MTRLSSSALQVTLAAVVLAMTARPLDAEVRTLRFGIGLNCPYGLGECWPQVFDGLQGLPGAELIAEEANDVNETCVVRPIGGRMLDPKAIADYIAKIRIGVWLRGVEATVDGRLELRGEELVLVSSETDIFRLAPLDQKIEYDFRGKRRFEARAEELLAFARLRAQWDGRPRRVRLTGPVVSDSAGAPSESEGRERLVLQVREFYSFGSVPPSAKALRLGVRANSPYGLTEIWATLRATLADLPGVASVASGPDEDTSRIDVETHGEPPNLRVWSERVRAARIGAQLAGIELALEGRIIKRRGQLALLREGARDPVYLAPISKNVAWDYRKRAEILPSTAEENAYYDLLAAWSPRRREARVAGVFVGRDGEWILEVKDYRWTGFEGRAANARDLNPPRAPRTVRARVLKGNIDLRWAPNVERDLAGYRVYRAEEAKGPYVCIVKSLVRDAHVALDTNVASPNDWLFVTAVDRTGNESAKSRPSSAAPPQAPGGPTFTLRGTDVALDWKDNVDPDFDSYSIHRSTSPGGPYGEIASVIYDSTYVNGGLRPGNVYYYVVTAMDSSYNESARSTEICVRVPAAPAVPAVETPTLSTRE